MIELLNSTGAAWAEYFGLALVQNTVFLGLVFLALHLLRNASAGVKAAVASLGLAKLLLPPFLPASVSFSSQEVARTLPQVAAPLILGRPAAPEAGTAATAAPQLEFLGAVFVLWIMLGAAYLLLTAAATARLAWRTRNASPVEDDITREVIGTRRIRVLRSGTISTPLCVGLLPRKIFVPAAWDGWSADCRRTVLKHELAHIDRRDGVLQGLQIVAQAIYFCHPLVWLLGLRLREYREMACDDASAGSRQTARIAYSRCLVEVAESVMRNPVRCESATTLMERRRELLERVRYQMNGSIAMSKKKLIITVAALAILVVPLSWYHAEVTPADAVATPGATQTGSSHKSIIQIDIRADDTISVNGVKGGMDDVETLLQHTVQEIQSGSDAKQTIVVVLTCGDDVRMGTVFDVQGRLRKMDLMNMSYTTSAGKDLTLILPPIDYEKRLSEIPAEHISELVVLGRGKVKLAGKRMKSAQLSDAIRKILEADDKHIISMQISEKARYGDFVEALEMTKRADAQRILVNQPAG